jgi:hypothetical protein
MLKVLTQLVIPAETTLGTAREVIELLRGFAAVEYIGDPLHEEQGISFGLDVEFIIADDDEPVKVAKEIVGVVQQIFEVNANLDGTGIAPIDIDELEFETA